MGMALVMILIMRVLIMMSQTQMPTLTMMKTRMTHALLVVIRPCMTKF